MYEKLVIKREYLNKQKVYLSDFGKIEMLLCVCIMEIDRLA